MKLRKTRIKKTTKVSGAINYVAEYKSGFWWYQFDDTDAPDSFVRMCWANHPYKPIPPEEYAKSLVDYYIAQVKYRNACEIENKVVKVEYEDYP